MSKRVSALCFAILIFAIHIYAQKPKVAFVLSGGGARGFAHVGALKVLERAGIKPDIITGTSMGSVIGGMYAIGYRSDTLEKIISNTNWDDVVYDAVSRQSISVVERERYDRYFIKLNFEGIKFLSYSGLVKGTKVHNLLSNLSLPVSNTRDFHKYPTAFECIATDIQTGKKIVLDSGELADAIRASMAIPTLFNSMEINDRILVDGGLTQNYPIIEAKNLGADIIIGIDVGTKSSRDELSSFMNIMMEAIFLHGYQNYDEEKKYLDLNIKPDMNQISPLDFNLGDSIMHIGERSAMLQWEQLLALSKKINGSIPIDTPLKTNYSLINKKYKVKRVDIVGLKSTPSFQLNSITDLSKDKMLTAEGIDNVLEQLQGTNLFDDITYHFENSKDEGVLQFHVKEKPSGQLDAGIGFNSYMEASLFLGLTYRNLLFKGSRLRADMRLSSMPRLDVSYYYQTRYRPSIGVEFSTNNITQGLYSDTVNNSKISTVNSYLTSFYLKSRYTINNFHYFGLGVGLDYFTYNSDVIFNYGNPIQLSNAKRSNNFTAFYHIDTRDDGYIPTEGSLFKFQVYWADNDFDILKSWVNATLNFEKHANIFGGLYWSNYVDLGYNGANFQNGNYQFAYAVGGMMDMKYRNYTSFAGLNFAQKIERNMVHYRMKFPYRVYKNNFIAPMVDVGKLNKYFEDLIIPKDFLLGYGVSYEYRSPIGPLQFNVSQSNIMKSEFFFYFNLGYWF